MALLNATIIVLAMVAHEKVPRGNIAVVASLSLIGMVNLAFSKRRPPPDA